MKKIFLIVFLLLLAYEAYPQIRLSTMTEVTSLDTADLFWVNEFVTPNWVNRKLKWLNLRSNMIDYIEGLANTWAGIQTFNGATFNSGSHGKVLFNGDSVVITTSLWAHWLQRYAASSIIGNYNAPFFNVYAKTFTVINADETDSASISISSTGKVAITDLLITETLSMDSAATLQALKLKPESYAIADVNDTVITTATLMSNMQLVLPGDVAMGIETINMDGVAAGHILIVYTTDIDDSVLIHEESDGNLKMAGDVWLRAGDNIAFMYIYDQPALGWYWMELWRKDN